MNLSRRFYLILTSALMLLVLSTVMLIPTLQVLQVPALHRVHDIRHFMRRIHQPEGDSDTTQTHGCRLSGQELRPGMSDNTSPSCILPRPLTTSS
jgi:hypothetical protein